MKINRKKIESKMLEISSCTKQLGENLTKILKTLDIQQQELARLADVKQGMISGIAKGAKLNQSWFPLYKISITMGIYINDLIEGNYSIDEIGKRLKPGIEKVKRQMQKEKEEKAKEKAKKKKRKG